MLKCGCQANWYLLLCHSVSQCKYNKSILFSLPPQLVLLSASKHTNMIDKYTVAWHEWCSPVLSSLPNIHVKNEKVSSDLWDVCLPARQNKTSGRGLMLETRITNPWNSLIQALPLLFVFSDAFRQLRDNSSSRHDRIRWLRGSVACKHILKQSVPPQYIEYMSRGKKNYTVNEICNPICCFSYKMRLNGEQWTID